MKSVANLIERFIRQDIQSGHAYAVQPARGMVKLDAMENPYRLEEELQQELGRRLAALPINRYPAQQVQDLRQAIGRYVDLPPGHDVMLGNGSDELIALLAMACDKPGATIVAPEPGFVMYRISAQQQGLRFIGVPLTATFELDAVAMLEAIRAATPAIVFLAYPNNPTANLWDAEVIRSIIAVALGLVVLDEAYQPFASRSWLDEIRAHPQQNQNVLLLRTLSKFGLAGARLGYMLGLQALIGQIDKLRPPYNISVLNAECGLFALEHRQVYERQARDICLERERLSRLLYSVAGVQVFPSEANMVLVRVPDANAMFDQLMRRGVLVKNVSMMHPLLTHCLRLTVGTPAENDQLLQAMRDSL